MRDMLIGMIILAIAVFALDPPNPDFDMYFERE